MDYFGDTAHHGSLLRSAKEQPEGHLDAQASQRGFGDGGWQNPILKMYPYLNKSFLYLVS